MPNTAVKPANAESTWGEAPWEDRKPLITKREQRIGTALFLHTTTSHLPRASPGISSEPRLKERKRRANECESLMSGPYVSSTCYEEVFMCADPTDRCDDRKQETYTSCMRSFFCIWRLPILPGSWDKQRSAFKGAKRRIKATESLMSGPGGSSTCYEEVFMCADPTDRCDDR